MKVKGSTLRRRVITIVSALVSTLMLSGSVAAFARPLGQDGANGPVPAAPPVSTDAAGGLASWIIALIVVVAVAALSAALIGAVRVSRTRARTITAGA